MKLEFLTVHLLASSFLLLDCMYYEDRKLEVYMQAADNMYLLSL